MSNLSSDQEVPRPAAAALATGGTDQAAPPGSQQTCSAVEPSRDDARDAARYRWLRQARGVYDDTGRFPQGEDLDECCDAFMAKQGSSEVKPTEECNHPRSELLARKGDAFEMRKCHDCTKIFRVRLPEKAPVKAGDPCPTFDSTVHEAHDGKCMYCGAPMPQEKAKALPLCNCKGEECHGPEEAERHGHRCRDSL